MTRIARRSVGGAGRGASRVRVGERRGSAPGIGRVWRRGLGAATLLLALVLGAAAAAAARPPRARAPVTLSWVGDIAFGAAYGLPAGGPVGAMAAVRRQLAGSDVLAGNLEGTLGTGGASKCAGARAGANCFAFQAPPAYAEGLRTLGFSVMNLANNHALDSGPVGERETVAALDRAGVGHTGRPGEITIRTVRRVRIAFLGFAPYSWASSLIDIPAAQALIRAARRRARLVVVFIHAGAEGADETHTPRGTEYFLGETRGDPRHFAHAAIDAGAAIVLGSGPHVIRGIERYRDHLIAYSLGDFAGPHTLATGGVLSDSAILRVTLSPTGRVLRGRWISVRLVAPGVPTLDPANQSARRVARLSREDFGVHRYPIAANGAISARAPSARLG